LTVFVVSVALFVVAACNGGDSGKPAASDSPGINVEVPTSSAGANATAARDATGSPAPAGAVPTAAAGDAGGGSSSGSTSSLDENSGAVTIGDETWIFDVSSLCRSTFDAFSADGSAEDGSDVDVHVSLPPNDWATRSDAAEWQPPSIRVWDDVNSRDWIAGGIAAAALPGVEAEMSQITSFSIEGFKAWGSASFVESYALQRGEPPQPVSGTFEFHCDVEP
jgi:hypothetical protein